MWSAFPTSDYYGPSAPPDGISRQRTVPPPTRWLRAGRAPSDGSHVHLYPFDGVGAQLCPCTIATAYAADLHHGLPVDDIGRPGSSPHPPGAAARCAIDARMTSHLADAALRTAIARRSPTGTVVVHSDRGGQFRSHRYQRTLRAHGLTGSMGRVSSAGDNAAMESFFSLLQKNVLNRQSWTTRDELRLAIITWRTDLPPPPTPTRPRQAHPRRVRSHHRQH